MISYDSWEYIYFQHILNLHQIFCKHIRKLDSSHFYTTFEFLKIFGQFIKKFTKCNVSEYKNIDELNENTFSTYEFYKEVL